MEAKGQLVLMLIGALWCGGCGRPAEGEPDAGVVEADAGRELRPFSLVSCTGAYYCQTGPADVCAALVDLAVGDTFAVAYDNRGASWPAAPGTFVAHLVRGVPATESYAAANGNGKSNTATLHYDGECAVWGVSSYCCNDTGSYSVAIAITDAGYGE